MNFNYGITVTVKRYTTDDRTGDRVHVGDHEEGPFAFDPGGTREVNNLGVTVTSTPKLYGPYVADVTSDDELLVPGDSTPWEVDGDIARWQNPFTGTQFGCIVELTRQRG